MKRRRFLESGVGVALIGVSGCLDDGLFNGTNDTDSEPSEPNEDDQQPLEPKELPNRPSQLGSESATAYVKEYEEVHQYNTTIRPSYTAVSATCSSVLDHEAPEGFYVSTVCWVSDYTEDAVGEGPSNPALYLVNSEETIRVEAEIDEYEEPYLSPGHTPNDGYGIWVSNFDDQPRELAIQLDHRKPELATVFDETVHLGPEEAAYIASVTSVSGEYELQVALPTGDTTVKTLVLPDDSGQYPYSYDPFYAVHVTPDGTVETRTINFEDPT